MLRYGGCTITCNKGQVLVNTTNMETSKTKSTLTSMPKWRSTIVIAPLLAQQYTIRWYDASHMYKYLLSKKESDII